MGAVYSSARNESFARKFVPTGEVMNFQGLIVNNPAPTGNYQNLYVKTKLAGADVEALVKTARYPSYEYGDLVIVNGAVKNPEPESYAQYLAKERISAVVSYPQMKLVSADKGSPFKAFLFDFKNSVVDHFGRMLPAGESAFLSGLLVGERSDFSKEFKAAMQTIGTTHLVALSGYNVTIIVTYAMVFFALFFRRRFSIMFTFLFLLGFVLMTGAEASVVRAAIMVALVVIAQENSRIFNIRNAIMLAAFTMVLINPKILVFDIGFELSFLALIGIVYLKPVLRKLFRMKEEAGVFSWRENLITTTSAQLMVVPILVQSFGSFSPISLLSNVLILEFIPLTMALGFGVALLSGFSYYPALIASWLIWPFLKLETGLIEFFGGFDLALNVSLSWFLILAYYGVLFSVIFCMNRRERRMIFV